MRIERPAFDPMRPAEDGRLTVKVTCGQCRRVAEVTYEPAEYFSPLDPLRPDFVRGPSMDAAGVQAMSRLVQAGCAHTKEPPPFQSARSAVSKPLTEAEIASLRATVANPLLHVERVTDIAAALPLLLDEVDAARKRPRQTAIDYMRDVLKRAGADLTITPEGPRLTVPELDRSRALLDQAVAMFAPGIEEDGKLWRLAEARGDLAKCISRGDFWERLPEAEAWLAAARGGSGETWHDRARALLKRIEWNGGGAGYCDSSGCPACHADLHDDKEHTTDCELAALIGGK